MLRCLQLGLSPADLEELEFGMVVDMLIEAGNDGETWEQLATQEDFDRC